MPEHPTEIDLDSAIQLLVNEGERDPLLITRHLLETYGEAWAKSEVALRAPEFIEMLARMLVRHLRPVTKQLVLHPGQGLSPERLHVYQFWVPGEGYKPAADVTASDLRERADWHMRFAEASAARAAWCEETIQLMRHQRVERLGEVEGPLPLLPSGESLREILG